VIHLSHAVPNPVVRAMTQPMDCPVTVRSHVWLYINDRLKRLHGPALLTSCREGASAFSKSKDLILAGRTYSYA